MQTGYQNQQLRNNQQRGGYRGGRGGYPGTRGHYRGVRDGRVLSKREANSGANLNAATKVWECLWCQLDTHKTIDCRKMKRAQMARDQGDKPEASSSFVASDDNMLVDPPQEHQDVSCAAAQSFSSRCLFDWFADSGATQHMSDQRQLMINYKPIEPGTWSVSGIGGMTLPVLGVGDVPVITQINGEEQDFLITGVLQVDKIGVNLFSIGAATAKGMKGFFSGNKCFFYSDKQLILTGERAAKTMYYLNIRSQATQDFAKSAGEVASIFLWHRRLGHADSRNIKRMCTNKLVDGLELTTTQKEERICSGCAKGKMHRLPFQTSVSPKMDRIGGRIYSDVCGPMSYASLGGARFYVLFKDEFSGWIKINFMKSKSEVLYYLQSFSAFLKNHTGETIQRLRTDNGTEYVNAATSKWTMEMGIHHETSATYTPEQNGTSKRVNRTIMESARSMMHASGAPSWIWAEAVNCAVYIRNRIPSSSRIKSPFEILNNWKPSVSHIKIFGSKTFVHIPHQKRNKLEPKCFEGALVGFCDTTKGYRVYIPKLEKVIISRDVIIDESISGFNDISKNKAATKTFVKSTCDPFIEQVT